MENNRGNNQPLSNRIKREPMNKKVVYGNIYCRGDSPYDYISPNGIYSVKGNILTDNNRTIILKPIRRERVVEVMVEEIKERIINVPQVQYVDKFVEVVKPVVKYKIKEVKRPVYVEKIKRVPKIIEEEKIVEVPEIKYVDKIVDVPKFIQKEKIVEVPLPVVRERRIPILNVSKNERFEEVEGLNYNSLGSEVKENVAREGTCPEGKVQVGKDAELNAQPEQIDHKIPKEETAGVVNGKTGDEATINIPLQFEGYTIVNIHNPDSEIFDLSENQDYSNSSNLDESDYVKNDQKFNNHEGEFAINCENSAGIELNGTTDSVRHSRVITYEDNENSLEIKLENIGEPYININNGITKNGRNDKTDSDALRIAEGDVESSSVVIDCDFNNEDVYEKMAVYPKINEMSVNQRFDGNKTPENNREMSVFRGHIDVGSVRHMHFCREEHNLADNSLNSNIHIVQNCNNHPGNTVTAIVSTHIVPGLLGHPINQRTPVYSKINGQNRKGVINNQRT